MLTLCVLPILALGPIAYFPTAHSVDVGRDLEEARPSTVTFYTIDP